MGNPNEGVLKLRILKASAIFEILIHLSLKMLHLKEVIVPIKLCFVLPFISCLFKAVTIK